MMNNIIIVEKKYMQEILNIVIKKYFILKFVEDQITVFDGKIR